MTESEWLACTDPGTMMGEIAVFGTTHRKARLFCCAYCRLFFWDYLPPGIRDAVEVAEAYANQTVSKYKLRKAQDAFDIGVTTHAGWRAHLVAQFATRASDPFGSACMLLQNRNTLPWRGGKEATTPLIREIFSNPFRPVTLAPAILTWHDGLPVSMAQRMYDSGDFSDMPILADALEEAGCQDADILGHCRSGGEHVRGCWIVDLVLGKQ